MVVDEFETVSTYMDQAQNLVLHQRIFRLTDEQKSDLVIALINAMSQVHLSNAIQEAAKKLEK